jgi:putative hydrolase of HD superfamily
MHVKAPFPLDLFAGERLSPIVEAYVEFSHLKQLYRQGWLRRGIAEQRCESVAEHALGVAMLALFVLDAYPLGLDRDKVLRLALLHDLGEVYAGDLMPSDLVSTEEKHQREAEAVARVVGKLPNGAEHMALWHEYEAGQSREARFVRQVDRLEMGLQAAVYERQEGVDLSEFYESVREALSISELRAILSELEALRYTREDAQEQPFLRPSPRQ